jgi:Ca2+-binding EF-hand superfamily protein
MNADEFKQVLIDLGKRDVTEDQVKDMLASVDRNNDKVIQWEEFLEVIPLALIGCSCSKASK